MLLSDEIFVKYKCILCPQVKNWRGEIEAQLIVTFNATI